MIVTSKNIKRSIPGIRPPKGLRLLINAALQEFEELEVTVKSNYYDSFGQILKPDIKTLLGTYLKDTTYNFFGANDLCPEMPVPKNIAEKLQLEISGDATSKESRAVALLHVGRKSSLAPLHFDWDHDSVLHTSILGRKTFFFFPPEAGWLLMPVVNTSALCIPRLSAKDRASLLTMLGGFEITIGAGESVFFPSLWWHAVLYDEPNIGLSVRFSDRTDLRAFSVLPRSWWLQRLVYELFRSKKSVVETKAILVSCGNVFFSKYATWQDRYQSFNKCCREHLIQMKSQRGARYLVGENFNAEVALAGFELEELYTLPKLDATHTDQKEVGRIKKYLFEFSPALASSKLGSLFAKYALATRSGLPPQRGLIPLYHN